MLSKFNPREEENRPLHNSSAHRSQSLLNDYFITVPSISVHCSSFTKDELFNVQYIRCIYISTFCSRILSGLIWCASKNLVGHTTQKMLIAIHSGKVSKM